jgi:transcriptional regulator GlxA family with amidase domain
METIASLSPTKGNVPFQKLGTLATQYSKPRSRLERIQHWEALAIEAGYDSATMAALCPISLRQLERFFKLQFGKSPRSWLLELQCGRARHLVERGYSNKSIAAELHFADESHLCHAFKKVHGSSPQTFAPLYGADVAWSQECRSETDIRS